MAIQLATAVRNALLDAITTQAGSAALIRVYSGSRPASPQVAISGQTLLGTLTASGTFAPAASGGVLTANAITQDSSADASGTASFFRVVKSDGTTVLYDGDCGAGSGDLNLNTTNIVIGGPIIVNSLTITAGNA